MPSPKSPTAPVAQTFERTMADLKQGVAAATAAQAEASEKVIKTAKDVAAFYQGTLQAFTEASKLYAAGSQDLFRQMTASNKAAISESVAGVRALMAAKTVQERIELQTSLVRASTVAAVSETGRFAMAGYDLAEKASAPLTARVILAVETFSPAKI